MMGNTSNTFSPEARGRAVRRVLDHEHQSPSRRAAITSVAAKIGCAAKR
jgi:transposase